MPPKDPLSISQEGESPTPSFEDWGVSIMVVPKELVDFMENHSKMM